MYENIALGLRHKGLSKQDIKARVNELLDLFGLKGKEQLYPNQLSGEQKQKVVLARALAPWPEVVLLDESLSSIDPGVKGQLRIELRDTLKSWELLL